MNLKLVIKLALCLDPDIIVHRGMRVREKKRVIRIIRGRRSRGSAGAAVPFFGGGGLSCTSFMNFLKSGTRTMN